MPSNILTALPGEEVLYSSSLGIVTQNCVVLKAAEGQPLTILSLSEILVAKRVIVTYPILLVVSIASAILAAAALCSKEGGGAGIPFAVTAAILLFGYFGSRRGSVLFLTTDERFETVMGSPATASKLIAAVERAVGKPLPEKSTAGSAEADTARQRNRSGEATAPAN